MSVHPAIQAGAGKENTKQNVAHQPHHHKYHSHSAVHSLAAVETPSSAESNPPLPKGCKPLAHQVAGHRFGHGRSKLGMLQHADGSILKPIQSPPRGECELNFYTKVFDSKCEDPVLQTLRPFLPKFLGLYKPIIAGSENESMPPEYLKLEDACRRFRNPSILDIKIGKISYDPNADEEKIAFETGKYPPLKNLGFQILGARVSGQSPNEAIFYDKKWGRSFTEENITEGLEVFFSGNKSWRKHMIKAFLQRLETILIWFDSQSQLQFYSSSLLLIYEGEFFDGSSDSDEEFMHKYRTYRPNSNMKVNECFHAIEKVLKANIVEDVKVKSLQETSESPTHTRDVQKATHNSIDDEDKNKSSVATDHSDTEERTKQNYAGDTTPRKSDENQNVSANLTSRTVHTPIRTGNESGYSSEVDSKKVLRNAAVKQEFVNNLSRRMRQHAMIQYSKYRFPPELVDVRMIDFTHVFTEPRKDENYIYGLRNFIAHLRHLLKRF